MDLGLVHTEVNETRKRCRTAYNVHMGGQQVKLAFAFVQCERATDYFFELVAAARASSECLDTSPPALEIRQMFRFYSSTVVSSLGLGLLRNAPC